MAEFELGIVLIIEEGDFEEQEFYCYYEDSNESIIVRDGLGNIVTSAPTITKQTTSSRIDRGFSTVLQEEDKYFLLTFVEIDFFPFFLPKKTETTPPDGEVIEITDVRDISLRYVSMIMPTGKTETDGEITIEANGTNAPFKYYTTDPRDFVNDSSLETGQDTGEFTGLTPGTYTFYAAGYGANNPRLDSTSITITLVENEIPSLSSYGARWQIEYENFENTKYRTEILEREYTLPVEVVKGSGNPYGHTMRGEGDDVYQLSLLSSNVNVNLIDDEVDKFKDIAIADEKKYVVLRSKFDTNESVYVPQWTGYVTPSSYQDVLYSPPYNVSISANDRIGDLKGFKFLFGDNDSGNFVKGNVSQLSIIHICLQKLFLGFGYRIACNIFAEDHITTDATPLDQTLLNVDTYLNDDGTDVAFCDEVVKDILEIYGATLFSWEGYWYIVRQEEWLNETINYVQYNNDIEFESNGSWNPRIDFKRPKEDDRARFINGAQNRIFTALYGKVNLTQTLDLLDDEGNLLPSFTPDNVEGNKFKGFDLINNGSNIGSKISDSGDFWEITLSGERGSKSYIEATGIVDYTSIDRLDLKINVDFNTFFNSFTEIPEYPPYMQLKWSLKVGSVWYGFGGSTHTQENINSSFINKDSFNADLIIPIQFSGDSSVLGSDYILRVYPIDIEENIKDIFRTDLIPEIKVIPTTGKYEGYRLSIYSSYEDIPQEDQEELQRIGVKATLWYYELVFGSGDDGVQSINPNDQSSNPFGSKVWVLRGSTTVPFGFGYVVDDPNGDSETTTLSDGGWFTKTKFNSIGLDYKPSNESKLRDSFITSSVGESKNNIDLDYEINQFDIIDVRNGERLVKNFLKYEDLKPTSNWKKTDGTITKSIQAHLLDWLTRLSKRCRGKISGNWRTDGVDCTPINVLHDPNDNNRLYLPIGMSSNFKLQEYSGELLEVGSGDDISTSAFTTGFKQDAVR